MARCRVEQDELDFDTQRGLWEPVKSLFDYAEPCEDLEPEDLKKPGKWMRCGDSEFYVFEEDK